MEKIHVGVVMPLIIDMSFDFMAIIVITIMNGQKYILMIFSSKLYI